MSSSLTISEEPLFDPNAFGMATLLGGLFILGIASDMMINSSTDLLAWSLAYFGFALIICSLISFTYSFVYCFKIPVSTELRPLITTNDDNNISSHQQYYGSNNSSIQLNKLNQL